MTFTEKNSITYQNDNRKLSQTKKECPRRCGSTIAVECLTVGILFSAYLSVDNMSKPLIAYFTCDQTDILEPYKPNTVSTMSMIVLGNSVPILTILLIELANSNALSRLLGLLREKGYNQYGRGMAEYSIHAINLFFLGEFTTVLITETSKRWVGRLRPHFMEVCKPRLDSITCFNKTLDGQIYNSIYTGGDFCTGDPKAVEEARLSFPSGHASFTTYCVIYLIIYLEARFFVTRFHFGKRLIQISAFVICIIICLSRISDFQHRPSDVVGGSLLGLSMAICVGYIAKNVWSFEQEQEGYLSIKANSDESIKVENYSGNAMI